MSSLFFESPDGGVLTREAGALTGDLEIGYVGKKLKVRYAGTEEWYTLVGNPQGLLLSEVVEILEQDHGTDPVGNPLPSSL